MDRIASTIQIPGIDIWAAVVDGVVTSECFLSERAAQVAAERAAREES